MGSNAPEDAKGANAAQAEFTDGAKEAQPAYDWQAAFQAFYAQGQRHPSAPAPNLPNPWQGHGREDKVQGSNVPAAFFGGGMPGPFFPGAYNPFMSNSGSAVDPAIARVKGWLPGQLSGQLSEGGSLQRGQGSLGSLGNLLKSNGESQSHSSGGSESSHEDDKTRVNMDLAPGLQILRKRSFEHMGLDAVAAGGTGSSRYQGRGAFASAASQDFPGGPNKPVASVKGLVMEPSLQPLERGGSDMWLRMGQGADLGLGDGGGDVDDKEVRKQRRKQSNRESARRSRLRKQAECEELSGRVDHLNHENGALRTELVRLSEQCAQLASDNRALQEELLRVRSRGHSWRPAAALPPSMGSGQARRDKPPPADPPFFHPGKPHPERAGRMAAAEPSAARAVAQDQARQAESEQFGEGVPGTASWREPRQQRPPAPPPAVLGQSENGAVLASAAVPSPEAQEPPGTRPNAALEAPRRPALQVPGESNGVLGEGGREAPPAGDGGPSTPGPTAIGNTNPGRDLRPAGRASVLDGRESEGREGE